MKHTLHCHLTRDRYGSLTTLAEGPIFCSFVKLIEERDQPIENAVCNEGAQLLIDVKLMLMEWTTMVRTIKLHRKIKCSKVPFSWMLQFEQSFCIFLFSYKVMAQRVLLPSVSIRIYLVNDSALESGN